MAETVRIARGRDPVTRGGDLMRMWRCVVCGFIYDEAEGLPEEGIPPGTRWEDISEDWECPECGATKEDFEMEEIPA